MIQAPRYPFKADSRAASFGFTPRWRPRNDVSSLVSRIKYNHPFSASSSSKRSAKAAYPSTTTPTAHPHNVDIMTDKVTDHSVAGTAKDNIPTQSNPMDNIHGTTEDISNKASGYKAAISNPNVKDSTKEEAKKKLDSLGGEDAFMKNNGKGE